MPVSKFMALALQHPDHGYYRQASPIGRDGDFITSPEISQVFGELIGLWLATAWDAAGRPQDSLLCEAGPGRGTLLSDALRAIRQTLPAFEAAAAIQLLESSATLRAQQAKTLSPIMPAWLDRFEDLPDRPLFLVANEFLDALPVAQFVFTEAGWCERMIGLDPDDRLVFLPGVSPSAAAMAAGLGLPDDVVAGDIHEVQPGALSLAREIASHLVRHGGAALLIDYGGNHPAGQSTLRGIQRHQLVDPLTEIGDIDLTVDVDFQAIRQAAETAGAAVHGPVGQGPFLEALGVAARRKALVAAAGLDRAATVEQAIDRLVDPDGMGKIFKVMAIAAPALGPLPGFPA